MKTSQLADSEKERSQINVFLCYGLFDLRQTEQPNRASKPRQALRVFALELSQRCSPRASRVGVLNLDRIWRAAGSSLDNRAGSGVRWYRFTFWVWQIQQLTMARSFRETSKIDMDKTIITLSQTKFIVASSSLPTKEHLNKFSCCGHC